MFQKGRNALMLAAIKGHVEIIELMLNIGANVNAKDNVHTQQKS